MQNSYNKGAERNVRHPAADLFVCFVRVGSCGLWVVFLVSVRFAAAQNRFGGILQSNNCRLFVPHTGFLLGVI
jgi:hypothetical protein